jgi:hypothetical protein
MTVLSDAGLEDLWDRVLVRGLFKKLVDGDGHPLPL